MLLDNLYILLSLGRRFYIWLAPLYSNSLLGTRQMNDLYSLAFFSCQRKVSEFHFQSGNFKKK